jgi:hypothetical protein
MFASPVPNLFRPEVIQAAWPILDQLISGVMLIDCENRTMSCESGGSGYDHPESGSGYRQGLSEFICRRSANRPDLDVANSWISEKSPIGQDSVVPVLNA